MTTPYDSKEEAVVTVQFTPSLIIQPNYGTSFQLESNAYGWGGTGAGVETWLIDAEFEGQSIPTMKSFNQTFQGPISPNQLGNGYSAN